MERIGDIPLEYGSYGEYDAAGSHIYLARYLNIDSVVLNTFDKRNG